MSTRHIVYMDMDLLKPAVRNPKTHDLPSIVASLRRYGWNSPAELDDRTGRLVVGHGRREACQTMRNNGEPPPAGVFIDDDGGWLVPVLRGYASVNDVEAEAYIIAQNKLSEAGGWHEKTLAQMLEDVVTEDAPLQETLGMDFEDIDALLARFDPETLNDPANYRDDPDDNDGGAPDPDPHQDLPTGDESVVKKRHTCPSCFYEFED